jgi:hypothetical protein
MENVFADYSMDVFMDACYLAVSQGYSQISPPGNSMSYRATQMGFQKSFPDVPWLMLRDMALALPSGEAFRRYKAVRSAA